ncbi:MAG: RNA-binding protein [Alphaproteobacteria bacterium]|nr:RNA-binding protein [Alphaproteobacteria bacterium]
MQKQSSTLKEVSHLVKAARREEDEEGPLRTCIVTRETLAPDQMIRCVRGPDGTLVPDLRTKLPGRGVWVTCSHKLLAEAIRKNMFGRALKAEVRIPETLLGDVEALMQQIALQSLSIANKAGLVVSGQMKVETALAKGNIIALIQAIDGGSDGARKLLQAAHRLLGEAAQRIEKVECFTSTQLDLALGRTNVIHAAIKRGAAGEAFALHCRRLTAFRSGQADQIRPGAGANQPAPLAPDRDKGPDIEAN